MSQTKEQYWKRQFNKVNKEYSILNAALIMASKALENYDAEKWSDMDSGEIFGYFYRYIKDRYYK